MRSKAIRTLRKCSRELIIEIEGLTGLAIQERSFEGSTNHVQLGVPSPALMPTGSSSSWNFSRGRGLRKGVRGKRRGFLIFDSTV